MVPFDVLHLLLWRLASLKFRFDDRQFLSKGGVLKESRVRGFVISRVKFI